MSPKDFRFLDPLRVRWAEVDMQRIVFNGHYLMYLDTAVGGYWRSLAMPYHETMEMLEGDLYVRKATLEYLASARYDERLQVGIRCERIGNSSMHFTGCVFRGAQHLVTSELVYVFADPATQTSRPVPPLLRSVLEAFEAREPMVSVATGTWAALADKAHPLRRAVFVEEQGIAPEIEADNRDADALHAVATNRFGMPVGTGRAVLDGQGGARIGRMAVLASVRGAGVGAAVLSALVEGCRQRGSGDILLHAQSDAVRDSAAASARSRSLLKRNVPKRHE
jgi:YbgC/YbaW family acyl-CoA thioester hydrolase